jgi:hypothetical protein
MIITRNYALKLIREGRAIHRFNEYGGYQFVGLGRRHMFGTPQLQYVVVDRLDIWRTDHYLADSADYRHSLKLKDDYDEKNE